MKETLNFLNDNNIKVGIITNGPKEHQKRKVNTLKLKLWCKGKSYGLWDSWFTNKDVINAHFQKGYHLIGALKTNRVIYPKGISIQVKDFAQYIKKNDVCLVTVNNSKYWTYRYEGNLNAVVLFC